MQMAERNNPPPHGLPDVDVRVHAHACVEIEHRSFRLLIDPWLTGPAFLGAWTQFPPPVVVASELSPDAILITHEHSDHFHEPTLDQFDRQTPIYVPDFPNQRMPRVLDQMGFANVRPLAFGALAALDDHFDGHFSVTAFEPDSIWNDAIYLIEVAGFRILNLNDAGINRRIEPLVCPVDLIIAEANPALIDTQHEMLELYGASHMLPCGSHCTWWDPNQQPTAELDKPTFANLQQAIGSAANVLPLLPGSSWNAASGNVQHARDGIEPTAHEAAAYCQRTFDADLVDICRQPARMISSDELSNYFLKFNHTPEAGFCEDMTARVVVYGSSPSQVQFELGLIISDGRIGITSGQPPQPSLTITVPLWAVSKVVLEDLSWDELRLGGWGSYDPPADPQHIAFWRMLQAPYFHRRLSIAAHDERQISHTTVMVNLIERSGPQAERILRRYGLHDAATLHSSREPLAAAAAEHGLEDATIERLVGELRRACA
jgi:CMP-N-acetylneuraminate monooxygenase